MIFKRALCRSKERCVILKNQLTDMRVSVVVRQPDGSIELLCKGADNVMLEVVARERQRARASVKRPEMIRERRCWKSKRVR